MNPTARQRPTPWLRNALSGAALLLPTVAALVWGLWSERHDWIAARQAVEASARASAADYAELIALRLHQQFGELSFIAEGIVGSDPRPDAAAIVQLQRLGASHPELFALNLLAADGSRIVWSTRQQSQQPLAQAQGFTPLPRQPRYLLGPSSYAARFGGQMLSMRYRMTDAGGRTLYFAGSPYRIDALLQGDAHLPWQFAVHDTRDGVLLGTWSGGRVGGALTQPATLSVPVTDLPLRVDVAVPGALVRARYLDGAWLRWGVRLLVVLLLSAAALATQILARQRATQAARARRLAAANAALAKVHHLGAQATDDDEALLQRCCEIIHERLRAPLVWVAQPDASGRFRALAAAGAVAHLDANPVHVAPDRVGGGSAVARAWREHAPVVMHGPGASARRHEPGGRGFGASTAFPLRRDGSIEAVLAVYLADDEPLDAETAVLLEDIAEGVAAGLGAADQRRRLTRLQRLYRALMSEGDVVLQATSAQDMLRRTCHKLVRETPFNAAWVAQPDSDGMFRVLAAAGEGSRRLPQARLVMDHDGALMTRAWRERRAVICNDREAAGGDVLGGSDLPNARWMSAAALPLWRGGELWAVLALVSPQAGTFDTQTMALAARLAALLGHGLDEFDLKHSLSRLRRDEAYKARHDALTTLPNRVSLEQRAPMTLARARRNGTMFAVGQMDLDDFKPVNDTYGHEAGDRLLIELAGRWQSRMREVDLLARTGGDEFVVVIEDLSPEHAMEQLAPVLARLHEGVEVPFEVTPGHKVMVGLSMGLALYPADGDNFDALLREADAAMYQSKAHKTDRPLWWRMARDGTAPRPETDQTPDPYGTEAATLLESARPLTSAAAAGFGAAFLVHAAREPQVARVFENLLASDKDALLTHAAAHLTSLLDPATTLPMVQRYGAQLGRVHALSGVDAALVYGGYALVRGLLIEQLSQTPLLARQRYRLLLIAERRLQDDAQAQLAALSETAEIYMGAVSAPMPDRAAVWSDAIAGLLDAVGALPGIRACQLWRPNAQGMFQVEASAGPAATALLQELARPGMEPSLSTEQPSGRGLIARAWRLDQPQHAACRAGDTPTSGWDDVLGALGVRSMLALPVHGAGGSVEAVLALHGAYRNQFGDGWARRFSEGLQQRVGQIWQRHGAPAPGAVLLQGRAEHYRQQLYAGALEMLVQPVIDLRDGRLVKVEALARLPQPDGSWAQPGEFMPPLGNAELDLLFRQGLEQALGHLCDWQARGLVTDLALNLPPSTLLAQDCALWVEQALRRHDLAPQRLILELLEAQTLAAPALSAAIGRLERLGVHLALDDLGTGNSSMERLQLLPVNIVKIDQHLLLGLRRQPQQTLALVGALLQLLDDLERTAVVEGLEDRGLVEAASVLGAQLGQGYGLARPMDARELPTWAADFRLPIDPGRVHTFLGAMAWHWRFMRGRVEHGRNTLAECPLSAFFDEIGVADPMVQQWHALVHAGGDASGEASRRLLEWLARQVATRT